jgi:hypothetical protein
MFQKLALCQSSTGFVDPREMKQSLAKSPLTCELAISRVSGANLPLPSQADNCQHGMIEPENRRCLCEDNLTHLIKLSS